jgi:hypothetical protein
MKPSMMTVLLLGAMLPLAALLISTAREREAAVRPTPVNSKLAPQTALATGMEQPKR